ncbi:hypothetical protein E2C01_014059 [Portunus trituberculatus]|uniref:Uncharacterized protein n=1 Tax=Portunus trituberculatus TaxID=210409 RepID=A0A5B7DIX8_PORTR|nr:hypothetical protein [Portunus trituberculatus]
MNIETRDGTQEPLLVSCWVIVLELLLPSYLLVGETVAGWRWGCGCSVLVVLVLSNSPPVSPVVLEALWVGGELLWAVAVVLDRDKAPQRLTERPPRVLSSRTLPRTTRSQHTENCSKARRRGGRRRQLEMMSPLAFLLTVTETKGGEPLKSIPLGNMRRAALVQVS